MRAIQQTLPPVDVAGVLADLATLRAVIAEANARYAAALTADAGRDAGAAAGAPAPPPATIRGPADVARLLAPELALRAQEQMWVVVLNSKNWVIDVVHLYTGTLNSSTVRVAELFRPAIAASGASLILAHSHPSGDPTPSPEDVRVTAEAVAAGRLLDIEVLDHVVLGHGGAYASLKERGLGFPARSRGTR